jgi:putative FmdB family regulatory protein
MPLYEYKCHSCGKTFEVIQKFSDEPLETHPDCGGEVEKLVSAPAFHLKGTGWYATDYAKNSGSGNKEDHKSDSHKDDSHKDDSHKNDSPKADSKPETSASTTSDSSSSSSPSGGSDSKPASSESKPASGQTVSTVSSEK